MLGNTLLKKTVGAIRSSADYKDISQARLGMEIATAFSPTFHESVEYKQFNIEHINCKWVLPHQAPAHQVLLYFHGGGYNSGSVQTHKSLVTQLCKHAGMKGLLFDYRLSPEHQYPAPIEDAVHVYQWLLQQGYAPQHIAFGGDSAGGGLAMATMMYLRDKNIATLPACYIGLSPWYDLSCSNASITKNEHSDTFIKVQAMHHWVHNYIGDLDPKIPYISPQFGSKVGLPPMYLHVSKTELLYDDSVQFANEAKAAGVEVQIDVYGDLLHVWHAFWPILKEGREANKKLGNYLKSQLAQSKIAHKKSA